MTAVAIVLAASLTALSVSPASAARPVPVTIHATVTTFNPFGGVWEASGAIEDSGSFLRTDLHSSGSVVNSPKVGAFQAVISFSGSQGTIVLRVELLGTSSGLTGHWQVKSGTAAYERLSGHGLSEFDFSTGSILFTGALSLR